MTNREIDALVHQHVMGFKWDEDRCRVCGWAFVFGEETTFLGCTKESCSMRPPPAQKKDSSAPYSTEPAASKQLRDRMRDLGWLYCIRLSGAGEIWAIFWRGGTEAAPHCADGSSTNDTEEMAVALAALKALGVEVAA